jgi:hypothetical protein
MTRPRFDPPGQVALFLLLTFWSAVVAPTPARAQNVILDEGTFEILQDGRSIGTETFTIRRTGQGAEAHVIANAVIDLETARGIEQVKPLLQTGPDLNLTGYQLEVSGNTSLEIAVTASGRRLLARTRSPAGDQEREYRATSGGVLLEQGVAHHYWFLSHLIDGTQVSVLVPRVGTQDRVEVRSSRPETANVTGSDVQARHVTLAVAGTLHEVWYDAEGRVLQVRIPEVGFSARRTSR